MVSEGRQVRVRWEGASRRAVAESAPDADGKIRVRFPDGAEAGVPQEAVSEPKDFEAKEPLHGIQGPLSAQEAAALRRRSEELLQIGDAAAAAEFASAALRHLALQLDGAVEQEVMVLRAQEVWEGVATAADEAGTSKVRFLRLLECPDFRGRQKHGSRNEKRQVPDEQMVPNERLCTVHLGALGHEFQELLILRARCWLALESEQRAVIDCNRAAAVCRLLAPKPPRRAPGVEITMPLLVLGIAMAIAGQIWVGIAMCSAGFLYDYFAQRRAKRGEANAELSEVVSLRGRAKLQQGLTGLAHLELNLATEILGPLPEGSEFKLLRRDIRRSRAKSQRPLLAPADAVKRTWRKVAADGVAVDAFFSQQFREFFAKADITVSDLQKRSENAGDGDKFELGYMDYCADGFQGM